MAVRTKAQREASARKAARTRKKNEAEKDAEKKRRAAKRKKGMSANAPGFMGLGDLFTPASAQEGVDALMDAAAGGTIAYGVDMLLSRKVNEPRRAIAQMLMGTGLVVIGRKPYSGMACAGAGFKQLLSYMRSGRGKGFMNDGQTYMMDNKFVSHIEELPKVLDASGNQVMNDDYQLAQNAYNAPYTYSSHAQ